MRYPEEMYSGSKISTDVDFYGSNLEEKIVKTRKPHKCCVCEKELMEKNNI